MKNERIAFLDWMRVAACFMVMYLMHMFFLPVAFARLGHHLPTPLAIVATAAATFACSASAAVFAVPKAID